MTVVIPAVATTIRMRATIQADPSVTRATMRPTMKSTENAKTRAVPSDPSMFMPCKLLVTPLAVWHSAHSAS